VGSRIHLAKAGVPYLLKLYGVSGTMISPFINSGLKLEAVKGWELLSNSPSSCTKFALL
jgi:hypothetical protein